MSLRERSGGSLVGFDSILGAARRGEQSQLGVLLDVYRGYLLSIASEKLSQDVVAKEAPSDLVQETLLQASQAFGEFRGSTELELRAWLNQILARKVIDVHRYYRDFAKRDVTREVRLPGPGEKNDDFLGGVAAVAPSAEMSNAENAKELEAALQALNDEQRQAIQLRSFDQLSFEEVGERLGRSADAARKLWTRAIQNLTLQLQSDESQG